jgi:trans-2-enoyl-CoA reductase
MTYEKFEEIISHMVNHCSRTHKAYELKLDLLEFDEDIQMAVSLLWKQVLTKEGIDWLDWFLYEKDYIHGNLRKDLKAWDADKKEICKDLKSLYKYLVKEKYFLV